MPSRFLSVVAFLALAIVMAACAPAAPVVSAPTTTLAPTPVGTPSPGAGPVAVWHLDGDGSGAPGAAVTFTGGHRFARGAVVLDGSTGCGATVARGPLDTSSSFTVSAWVGPDAVEPYASAVSQVGDVAAAFYLGFGEGSWAFSMKDLDTNEPGHTIRAEAAPAAASGTWTHLAGVFDQASGEIRLVVDGTVVATKPFGAPFVASGALRIGCAQVEGRPGDAWPGAIGRVELYQEALSAETIRTTLASARPAGAAPAWSDDATVPEALRGTWDDVLSDDEVERLVEQFGPTTAADLGIPGAKTAIRYGFDGNRWWLGFVFDGTLWLLDGVPEGDKGVMTVQGDEMRQTNGVDGWITYRWAIDGDELTLRVDGCVPQSGTGSCADVDVIRFFTERTFTRSGSDPSY